MVCTTTLRSMTRQITLRVGKATASVVLHYSLRGDPARTPSFEGVGSLAITQQRK